MGAESRGQSVSSWLGESQSEGNTEGCWLAISWRWISSLLSLASGPHLSQFRARVQGPPASLGHLFVTLSSRFSRWPQSSSAPRWGVRSACSGSRSVSVLSSRQRTLCSLVLFLLAKASVWSIHSLPLRLLAQGSARHLFFSRVVVVFWLSSSTSKASIFVWISVWIIAERWQYNSWVVGSKDSMIRGLNHSSTMIFWTCPLVIRWNAC
jgi:hypothetical protein